MNAAGSNPKGTAGLLRILSKGRPHVSRIDTRCAPGPLCRRTVPGQDVCRIAAHTRYSTIQLTFARQGNTFNPMVEFQDAGLDAVFHALGDATRRRMLRSLAHGERTVGQLAEPFQMSLAAASKHVKALEGAGLIRREIRGRVHLCRLEPAPLSAANDWLRFYEQFWSARLDRLELLLQQDPPQAGRPAPPSARRAAAQPSPGKPPRTPPRTPRKRSPT